MIIVLSPAKTLDYSPVNNKEDYSTPVFLDKSKQLIDELKLKHPGEISSLMSLSDKLTNLNVDRYKIWKGQKKPSDNAKQSVFVFKGDVYQGLNVQEFSKLILVIFRFVIVVTCLVTKSLKKNIFESVSSPGKHLG